MSNELDEITETIKDTKSSNRIDSLPERYNEILLIKRNQPWKKWKCYEKKFSLEIIQNVSVHHCF